MYQARQGCVRLLHPALSLSRADASLDPSAAGFRFVSEKVSHHPPVIAFLGDAPSRGWQICGYTSPSTKFWGRSMEASQSRRPASSPGLGPEAGPTDPLPTPCRSLSKAISASALPTTTRSSPSASHHHSYATSSRGPSTSRSSATWSSRRRSRRRRQPSPSRRARRGAA